MVTPPSFSCRPPARNVRICSSAIAISGPPNSSYRAFRPLSRKSVYSVTSAVLLRNLQIHLCTGCVYGDFRLGLIRMQRLAKSLLLRMMRFLSKHALFAPARAFAFLSAGFLNRVLLCLHIALLRTLDLV